jgi:hypothetical protein
MVTVVVGVTLGLMGLDVGWSALPGGGVEYIIQIAPHELEVFKQDKSIEGDIPSHLRDIRAYRIVVGNNVLPRQDPPKASPAAAATAKTPTSPAWPDNNSTSPSGQSKGKTAAYNPFAALIPPWDKYPVGQSPSDPSKRPGEPESAAAKKTNVDSKTEDKSPKVERLPSREPSREAPKETPKSSGPFTIVMVVLLGSLGGNLYMGWITWETRARYHALVRRRKKEEHHLRERPHGPDVGDESGSAEE